MSEAAVTGSAVFSLPMPHASVGPHGCQSVLLQIALELEKVALNDEYFIKRKLYPNVDFFSGELDQTCMTTLPLNPRWAVLHFQLRHSRRPVPEELLASSSWASALQLAAAAHWAQLSRPQQLEAWCLMEGLVCTLGAPMGAPMDCPVDDCSNMRLSGVHVLAWLGAAWCMLASQSCTPPWTCTAPHTPAALAAHAL